MAFELDFHRSQPAGAGAVDHQVDAVPRAAIAEQPEHVVMGADGTAAEGDDDVAGSQHAVGRRGIGDIDNLGTTAGDGVVAELLERHPDGLLLRGVHLLEVEVAQLPG